jgi:hypothetical protein
MFLQTGRAEAAGSATERIGGDLKKAWAQAGRQGAEPSLAEFGKALTRFGADLETLRTGDLLTGRGMTMPSAARLLRAARAAKEDLARHAPPLADILERVAAMAEPLAGAGADLVQRG